MCVITLSLHILIPCAGLALGMQSTIVPVLALAITVCISFKLASQYGVAMAALGMLSTLAIGLTIDGYGPISDNAGGIAEMCELGAVPSQHRISLL
jgi:Na+/H+-translocating membrane pyrophosphatase